MQVLKQEEIIELDLNKPWPSTTTALSEDEAEFYSPESRSSKPFITVVE